MGLHIELQPEGVILIDSFNQEILLGSTRDVINIFIPALIKVLVTGIENPEELL